MHLTGPQFRAIQYYLRHRDHPPTWGGFLRRFARTLALWAVVAVAGGWWFVAIGQPMLACLPAGLVLGAALREARQHHHVSRAWPAVAAIVDWERAEALAASEKHA